MYVLEKRRDLIVTPDGKCKNFASRLNNIISRIMQICLRCSVMSRHNKTIDAGKTGGSSNECRI
jgi:hypothetical protein